MASQEPTASSLRALAWPTITGLRPGVTGLFPYNRLSTKAQGPRQSSVPHRVLGHVPRWGVSRLIYRLPQETTTPRKTQGAPFWKQGRHSDSPVSTETYLLSPCRLDTGGLALSPSACTVGPAGGQEGKATGKEGQG